MKKVDEATLRGFTHSIVDLFEEILEQNDISIPDEFRDGYEVPEEEQARLFGETYYQLEDDIFHLLELLVSDCVIPDTE